MATGAQPTFKLNVTQPLISLIQSMMATEFMGTEERGASAIPNNIRAHAFITMGKFCLRNKILAREHINVYLR